MAPPPVFSLWIDGDLGRLERMCLASFLASGHAVTLFTYGDVGGIPAGVTRRDAREILADTAIAAVGDGRGRHAALADIFRYRGLAAGCGIWVDTDVACLAPLPQPGDILVGREVGGTLNNAVLYLAKGGGLLDEAVAWSRPGRIPFWLSRRKRFELLGRKLMLRPLPPARLPWGTLGPKLVTALLGRAGRDGAALPADRFYPLPWPRAAEAFEGPATLAEVVTANTLCLHLWNDRIRHLKDRPPVPGTIFHELCERFALS